MSGMAEMDLLVDIGNSNVKWAFSTADGFAAWGEARHAADDELQALLAGGERPRKIRVANVAGSGAGDRLGARLRETFGIAPVFARSAASGAGVRNGYADPSQLGVDRWLAICAAYSRFRAPLVVVDSGTATTVDIVSGTGEHQGGYILPGIALMQSALLGSTGDLARLSAGGGAAAKNQAELTGVPGRDTGSAIRGAAVQATAALVRSCADRLRERVAGQDGPGLVVLTGGAAPLLGPVIAQPARAGEAPRIRLEHRPHLVLEGLALEPACFAVAP